MSQGGAPRTQGTGDRRGCQPFGRAGTDKLAALTKQEREVFD
jgi:hypothetical protein